VTPSPDGAPDRDVFGVHLGSASIAGAFDRNRRVDESSSTGGCRPLLRLRERSALTICGGTLFYRRHDNSMMVLTSTQEDDFPRAVARRSPPAVWGERRPTSKSRRSPRAEAMTLSISVHRPAWQAAATLLRPSQRLRPARSRDEILVADDGRHDTAAIAVRGRGDGHPATPTRARGSLNAGVAPAAASLPSSTPTTFGHRQTRQSTDSSPPTRLGGSSGLMQASSRRKSRQMRRAQSSRTAAGLVLARF